MQINKPALVLVLLLAFFLIAETLSADSFFKKPNGKRGIFGEWITPPEKPAGTEGGIAAENRSKPDENNASKEKYYKWCLSLVAQPPTFGGMNAAIGFIGPGVQWAPVKHIGLGLWMGIPPIFPYVAIYGDNDNPENFEYFQDYFTVADGPNNPYMFYLLGYGKPLPSFVAFKLESYYFLSDQGLKGFYGGVEGGILANFSVIQAYSRYGHEYPIMHIEDENNMSNMQVLPTFVPIVLQGGPMIGYKLILWGITLDIKAGYEFSNNPLFNGPILGGKVGYSF